MSAHTIPSPPEARFTKGPSFADPLPEAACRGEDSHLWDPDVSDDLDLAIAICRACPELDTCRAIARKAAKTGARIYGVVAGELDGKTCGKGHWWADNELPRPDGKRRCRTCMEEYQARRNARRSA